MTTLNTAEQLQFPALKSTKVEASFDTPTMTTDFGALLLGELELKCGYVSNVSGVIRDQRNASYISHSVHDLIQQRVFQIAMGYEDCDDCDHYKSDAAFKVAVGKHPINDGDLSSQPTMSRLENMVTKKDLVQIGYALIENYLNSYDKAPKCIVLDMDPSAVICHGDQQLKLFNAHEDEYCLMPFHVFDGLTGQLITTVIHPGKTPLAGEIIALLKRIVEKIRARFPKTLIVFRADGHHSKPEVHAWCESHKVEFVIGQPQNSVLNKQFQFIVNSARKRYDTQGRGCVMYASGLYQAKTWLKPQRVVCRVLIDDSGRVDCRYIVTSFPTTSAKYLYANIYCGRGNAELYIKDHKTALKSDRASCTKATANQFRFFMHSLAYQLMHTLRRRYLRTTELAGAQFDTIRVRLLKVAAQVRVMKTKIKFHLPVHFPLKHIYFEVTAAIKPLKT